MVAGATQLVAHRSGRACGPKGVIVTVEEEQEGIAAELQQLAPLLDATVEHAPEHAAQDLDQLLRAHAASTGQLLRQCGEPGDVREAQRPLHDAPPSCRLRLVPLHGDLGDVPREPIVVARWCALGGRTLGHVGVQYDPNPAEIDLRPRSGEREARPSPT